MLPGGASCGSAGNGVCWAVASLGHGFGREHRLRRRGDIARAFREGRREEGQVFSFRILRKNEPTPRLLVVVGRRLGGAVARNRVKRGIRQGFRLNKELFSHLDTVVVPRPEAGGLSARELEKKFVAEFQEVIYGQRNAPHERGLQDQKGRA